MDGIVDYKGKIWNSKVAVRVIERHYENKGDVNQYIKYVCPVCEEVGLPHQLEHSIKQCPICNVNLYW